MFYKKNAPEDLFFWCGFVTRFVSLCYLKGNTVALETGEQGLGILTINTPPNSLVIGNMQAAFPVVVGARRLSGQYSR